MFAFAETASGSSCILREPVEYFRQFFHLTLLNHIVEQSDVYAAQCNSNFQITETELEIFLGTLLKMGLFPMPRYSMYWSTEVRCDAIVDAGSGRYCVTFILMTTVKRCSTEK
ncbi:PiggyBac transposable element-derived protein 2 [Trichinella sp. T8]|nr:PiggyBac transposable element-derived protein 2 [Trichinella sp. T8]